MVFDLNETPSESPRETATTNVNDDDDVVIIEHPQLFLSKGTGSAIPAADGPASGTTLREAEGKRLDSDTGRADIVFCTECGERYKPKFNGTPEQLMQWKCFKCLLKKGAAIGTPGNGGGGGGGLKLFDINASPPREADAEGVCSGPADHVASFARRVSDWNRSDKVQANYHSSFSGHPVGLLSTYSNMWPAEKRFHLPKLPHVSTDISKSGSDDIVDHTMSSIISLNRIDIGSTDGGRPQTHKSALTDSYLEMLNNVYLEGLREYITERKGVLNDGWHVKFLFCNERLKTVPVYHAPEGRSFDSMSDVARYLGLPSNSHPIQSENVDNEIVVMRNDTYLSQRKKESSGSLRAGNSRARLNILRSSISQKVSSSGVESTNGWQDSFPIRLENFYLISAGVIDLRPSYHSTNQIWPVGYRSIWHDKITGSVFVFDVTDGGDSGPNFMVQRYPCMAHTIPVSSTVLSWSKLGSLNGEDNIGKDESTRFSTIDEDSISIQMMLTEFSPPHLDDDLSSRKTGNDGLDSERANLPSSDSFSQSSGNLTSDILGRDSIGEFLLEGRSPSFVWEKVCETFFHACYEAYKQKGAIHFGCGHEVCEINVKELDGLDPLSKFSHLAGPVDIPKLIQSDHEFHSTCEWVAKWLQQDRFGLDAEFVQEIIEQLPGVTGCSEYSLLSKRKQHSTLQTVKSGFLQLNRKSDINLGTDSDGYCRNSKRPGQHSKHSELRGPFPMGKPLCSRLPSYLIGDALEVWEFSWRFSDILGLQEPFSFQELEEELINPWLDVLDPLENLGTGILVSGDVSSRRSREVPQTRVSSHNCQRCTGIVLAKSHGSLLKVLAGELLSKVAVYVDPKFDAGESKLRRGRKKDPDCSASMKKKKLDLMPVNEFTWPEIARRYILAVLSMDGNLDSPEIACRESGKVFQCLHGDGGTLCGSLTGVAALEADALLLAEATKKIFGSPKPTNEAVGLDQNESDAAGVSKRTDVNNSEVPEWAQVLEPVRKLPTNVGARIRRCVHEALQRNPPEWAKKKLEHSISKEVYKGNASGPTKRAVIEVLADVNREKPQQKPEKKEKLKSVDTLPDLIMKQCRIVLRRAVSADEDRVFCNLLGRTLLNPNDNDDEGLLGHPAMVSCPLDFRTIDLRLAAGAYCGSHEAFVDDVREVWQNVHNAYREQSDLIDIAESLSQQFEDLYEKEVLTLVQKTTVSASVDCSGPEFEKECDGMLAFVRESSLPKAPWDEGICKVCGMDKDDDNVLLCDSCDSEYHTYCLNPPLVRIPEGNWYCPSCVAGQYLQQSAAYGTQVVSSCAKRRYQGEYIHKVMEMLAQLAKTMELKEYWEFTLEERIFLMKFLCDEALSSAIIHDHIDQCASMSVDLQQKLRSLNSEWKILKFREESLAANLGKTKSTPHTSAGESGLNAMVSMATDEPQMPNGERISPFSSGSMQMEASSTSSQLKHLQSGKDGQDVDNLRSVDSLQKLGNSSSVSVQSKGDIMPGHNLSGTADKHMATHISPVQGQRSNQANATSSHECNTELSNLQNEISGLHDSIDSVESELLKVSVRKEFLGRDSGGRLYWVFARPGTSPWILVNGSLNTEQEFGPGSLFHNFTSWISYNSVPEVEELVNWLDDSDVRERELKESILLWQSNKSLDTNDVGNDILNRGKPGCSILSSREKAADPDFLVTKAKRALEKRFGPCLDMGSDDISKKLLHEGKITCEDRMYRCECLELLWTSRHHCFFCHKTFCTSEELALHNVEKCKVMHMGSESQMTEGSLKQKKMARSQPVVMYPGNLSIYDLYPNEKRDNRSTFPQGPQEPECPFNFEEIKAKFRTEDSLKELVKEIGLIGSKGVVSFVPSSSPYLNDPALALAPGRDKKGSLTDRPSVPESQSKISDNGANAQSANKKIPDYLRTIKNGKGEVIAEVERMKPPVFGERGQFSLTKDRSSVLGVGKSCIVRESCLRPIIGKASEVLRFMKINLLDMDAALPEAALRPSRSHLDRRCAWHKFVKSANSLYEMVQAIIILEDTIKTDYLRKDWWYWSSPSAAANISTLSALALRIYALDSAILYEKPCSSDDTAEILEADCKSDKEVAESSVPSHDFQPGDQPMPKMADSDSAENPRPRTRTSKRRKSSGG